MSTHYETLNVTRDAEDVVIESAYRALMKRYHPDKTQGDPAAAERAKEINAAYSTLRDPASRARYDQSLGRKATPRQSASQSAPRAAPQAAPQAAPRAEPPPERTAPRDHAPPIRSAPRSGVVSLVFIGLSVLIGVGAIGSFMGGASSRPAPADPAATAGDGGSALTDSQNDGATREGEKIEVRRAPPVEKQRGPARAKPSAEAEGAVAEDAPADPAPEEGPPSPPKNSPPKDLEGLF